MPLTQGEITKVLNRFHGEESVGVLLEANIHEHKVLVTAYESDFPIGLFAPGGPLAGKTVDIVIYPPVGDQLITKFTVANWSNQSDSIKAKLISTVVQGLSRLHLESVPWQEKVVDPVKNDLEKIYELDSKGTGEDSIDLQEDQDDEVEEDEMEIDEEEYNDDEL
mgnify:FL=1